VEVPDHATQKSANQLTIEGWFRLYTLSDGLPHLVSKPLRNFNLNSYALYLESGKIWLGYYDVAQSWVFIDTGYRPVIGAWTHYAMVINTDDTGSTANTMKLFVNGVEFTSRSANNPIFYDGVNNGLTPHPLLIGGEIENNNVQWQMNGHADEVSLYSTALAASQIQAIYSAGSAGKTKQRPTAAGSNVVTPLSDATVTFASVVQAGVTTQHGLDVGLLPPLPSNAIFTGLAYDISTTASYEGGLQNDVGVCFNTPALAGANFSKLRILHLEKGVWVDRTSRPATSPALCTQGLTSLSPFAIVQVEPPFDEIPDAVTTEDTPILIPFTLTNPSGVTSVTASSANTALVPNNAANLFVAGSGTNRTLLITPAADEFGTASITITVHRGASSASESFTLTVTDVNDPPIVALDSLGSVAEDSGAITISKATLIGNDAKGPLNESTQSITFVGVSSQLGGTVTDDGGANVVFTPAANFYGTAGFSYTIQDNGTTNGGSDPKTSAPGDVRITVTPINDAPFFTKGANQTVDEDAVAQTISGWATGISAGAPNESAQTLTFTVTNDNTALFSAQPAVTSNGVLTYTAAPNANGVATITVTLTDNGGTDNGGQNSSAPQTFVITVNPVNDAPSFVKGVDQTLEEDAAAQTISGWASGISAGPANESTQAVSFVVMNTNNSLFSTQPAISPTGTLTYTLAPDANGSATVSATLKDNGGTSNGGVDSFGPQTFIITVNAVDDAPTFTLPGPVAVNEDSGTAFIDDFATNFQPGPATATDEASQTLVGYTVTVTEISEGLVFQGPPEISNGGQLVFAAATNTSGTAKLSIVATDSGRGTAPHVNTSAPQIVTITVNPVNDAPSFVKGEDQIVNEDAGALSVLKWASRVSAGPIDEAGQTLTFAVTNNNNALFSEQPAVSPSGDLTYTPAPNQFGTATITVVLSDDGGTDRGGVDTSPARTFTITVNPVNDAPSFAAGPDQTIIEDAAAQTIASWASAIFLRPFERVRSNRELHGHEQQQQSVRHAANDQPRWNSNLRPGGECQRQRHRKRRAA
jgi:hypothetical protein